MQTYQVQNQQQDGNINVKTTAHRSSPKPSYQHVTTPRTRTF